MKYRALVDGNPIDCEFDLSSWPRVNALVGGRRLDIELAEVGPGVWWFAVDGRSVETAVTRSQDGYEVRVGEDTYRIALEDLGRYVGRATLHQHHGRIEIRAPMPGRVVRVLVEDGEVVEPGQGLLVLEAMKMQNEIKAQETGTVSLNIREGVRVNGGDLLATVK